MEQAVGLLATFFVTPLMIVKLGSDSYGVWVLAYSVLAYLRLADFGFQHALTYHVSAHMARKNWDGVTSYLSSGLIPYSIAAMLVMVVALLVAFVAVPHLDSDQFSVSVAQTVLLVLSLTLVIGFATAPICSLGPFHRYDILSYVATSAALIQAFGVVLVLWSGGGLVALALLVIAVYTIQKALIWRIRVRLFPQISVKLSCVRYKLVKRLASYASLSFVNVASHTLCNYTDSIVVAWFFPLEVVAIYVVPRMLVERLRGLMGNIAIRFLPTVSHLSAAGEHIYLQGLVRRYLAVGPYISAVFCIMIAVVGPGFLDLWVGTGFEQSDALLVVFALSAMLDA